MVCLVEWKLKGLKLVSSTCTWWLRFGFFPVFVPAWTALRPDTHLHTQDDAKLNVENKPNWGHRRCGWRDGPAHSVLAWCRGRGSDGSGRPGRQGSQTVGPACEGMDPAGSPGLTAPHSRGSRGEPAAAAAAGRAPCCPAGGAGTSPCREAGTMPLALALPAQDTPIRRADKQSKHLPAARFRPTPRPQCFPPHKSEILQFQMKPEPRPRCGAESREQRQHGRATEHHWASARTIHSLLQISRVTHNRWLLVWLCPAATPALDHKAHTVLTAQLYWFVWQQLLNSISANTVRIYLTFDRILFLVFYKILRNMQNQIRTPTVGESFFRQGILCELELRPAMGTCAWLNVSRHR